MAKLSERDLIYDWNTHGGAGFRPTQAIEFDDETLRDGLQSPSVTDPPIDDKLQLLHLMDALGIQSADIGLPGAGPRAFADVLRLAQEIVDAGLRIRANCAARTVEADILPIIEVSQKVGMPVEACTFLGSSPIRQFAEGWDIDFLLRTTEAAVEFGVKHGIPVTYVTEDTIRSHPEDTRRLYTTAVNHGATRVVVCDTVGHATPRGAYNLVKFVREVVDATKPDVKVDWHGHRDRGLDVMNTLSAIEAGADRVHGTALGIGERVGNTPMDLILVNCRLLGWIDQDLSALRAYCTKVAQVCRVPLPCNYPVVGEDAFRTGTGVHAAAIIKAARKGQAWLADRIYSGVPAGLFGSQQVIEVGPMSGESNVVFWLQSRGLEAKREWITKIFQLAKSSNRILSDEEIYECIGVRPRTSNPPLIHTP